MKRKRLVVLFMFACTLAMLVGSKIPSVHATTTTFTITSGSNDGDAEGASSVYATAHGTVSTADNSGNFVYVGNDYNNPTYTVYRTFLKFDTSSIPSGATISSAKLCLWGLGFIGSVNFVVNLQKWTGDTPIDTGDYNAFDGTNYDDGNYNLGSFVWSGWNNITLSNFALITKAGNTMISVRDADDVNSNVPAGREACYFGSSEWSFESYGDYRAAPQLTVSYTVDTTPPTYTTIGSNETIAGNPVNCYVLWADNVATSKFILGTNNTGSWINQTAVALSSNWGNYTFTLNSTAGVKVQWEEWCNDTSNNWNNTGLQTITTTASASITINSSPSGSGYVTVDGSAITTPHTYTWTIGDSHIIAANSPANLVSGQSQHIWSSWNDSGTQSHSITVPASATTYTATFQLQYYLTISGGNSPSGQGWYNSGDTTTLTNLWVWSVITDQSRIALTNYALDGTPTNPTRLDTGNYTSPTITMNTYHTAVFSSSTQYYVTLSTATSGTAVGQSGSQTSDNWYDSGSSASISATTPYVNGTTNRFVFLNWMWTRGGVAQANSSSKSFLITMSNYVTATAYWSTDLINLFSFSLASSRVDVASSPTINLRFRWWSDAVSVASGFTVKINGVSRTISSGWTNFTDTSATVQTVTYQITQAEGGAFYLNTVSPSETWERVDVVSGGTSGTYTHIDSSILVYYVLQYESDSSLVTDGTVSLNGTGMSYSALLTRWEENVTSPTIASNHYGVSAVLGNLYGITVINDTVGLEGPIQWYANLYLRTLDANLNALTGATVYLNNGSSPIPTGLPPGTGVAIVGFTGYIGQTVNSSGFTSWLGQTNNTASIYATWYGLTVNQTFTYTFASDVTLDIDCLTYNFTVSGLPFWAASNATITGYTYAANILSLNFNSTINNYVLISNCPIIPRYILNCTYNINTCFTPYSYLSLPHLGNTTISVSYENWTDAYIQSTDQTLSFVTVASGVITIQPSGALGDIGSLQFYCGSLGQPTNTGGFTTTSYSAPVLIGNYVVSSSSLTLSWGSIPSGSSSGGTTGGVSNLAVNIVFDFPKSTSQAQAINGTLYIVWTNYPILYIWQITCNAPYSNWIIEIGNLPLKLTATQYLGNISVPVTLIMPANTTLGSHTVPCSVVFQTPTGLSRTIGSSISLNIVTGTAAVISIAIPDLLMPSFIGLFLAFIIVSVFRRRKAPKETI